MLPFAKRNLTTFAYTAAAAAVAAASYFKAAADISAAVDAASFILQDLEKKKLLQLLLQQL